VVQTLETGRAAAAREAWEEAWEGLAAADRNEALSPPDLELLADAAWWSARPDDSVDALERAFTGYTSTDKPMDAARVALLLAYLAMRRLAASVARGWRARAERLLEGQPESTAHAFLRVLDVAEALNFRKDLDETVRLADEALEIARRTGSRDAESQALAFKGYAMIARGEWMEGLALIDEATSSALIGDAGLRSACDVYCVTIAACRDLGDFQRAGEWTEEADRWMIRHSVGGYSGVCRVHRAELKRLRGDWTEAEQEALTACRELERYHMLDGVGHGQYEVGEIRLHMGDLAGAEAAFNKAYEHGVVPQPGLALVKLARGDAEEAARSLQSTLDDYRDGGPSLDLLTRSRLLPAQVEVALVRDDVDTARAATKELERLAMEYQRPAFEAIALTARGSVLLHGGDHSAAARDLDRAWRSWRETGFPYESARARMLLGRAHVAAGEIGMARMELGAARSVFEHLGAKIDVREVKKVLADIEGPNEDRARVTKTFMFTDIVTSTDLVGLIGDEQWEALLAWHDRALRAAFAEHDGTEVSHTGDGFFVTFDRAGDAVEAAVTIQRRLVEHRREHGFAPQVRVGLHTDEATLDGSDYRGKGVHLAARVGSAAGAEEIVLSAAALDAAGELRFPVSEVRLVELKGIEDAVELRTIEWRTTGSA
jgi:class 3 adenylate cyclase